MNDTFIIEVGNSNPKIMKRNNDGTYSVIGFAAGDTNLDEIIRLVDAANTAIRNSLA